MWKINFSLILFAIIAITISRKVRLSQRYERNKGELSPWKALDQGIDPTDEDHK